MGWRKPNCLMLDATFSIAAEEITRGFLAYGTTRSSGQTSTRNSDRSKQIPPFDKKIEFRGRARVASAAVYARPYVEILPPLPSRFRFRICFWALLCVWANC